MRYNLANPVELKAARNRISYLARKKRETEVKEIRRNRTMSQNSYLHLLLGAFGMHFGYTIEEAKLIYKEVNRSTYFYRKKDRTFMRSSADLDVEEMARTIDKFMEASAEAGYELPLATNQDWLREIENAMEKGRRWL